MKPHEFTQAIGDRFDSRTMWEPFVGVVATVPTGTAGSKTITVFIEGSAVATKCHYGAGYGAGTAPAVNDVVFGYQVRGQVGPDYVVLDKWA